MDRAQNSVKNSENRKTTSKQTGSTARKKTRSKDVLKGKAEC